MSANIPADAVVQKNNAIIETRIDNEIVMMSAQRGEYYGLDAISGRIWGLIDAPTSVASICAQLVQEYRIDYEQCQKDVVELLKDMADKNIICVCE